MIKRLLLACLALLVAQPVLAVPRCNLDTSNPAITHVAIPLHTLIQGVTEYVDPTEWPQFSHQLQWVPAAMLDMPGHLHMIEWCFPYGAEWVLNTALTIPFRVRTFMEDGVITNGPNGRLISDVVYDSVTPPFPLGSPSGEVVALGHLTVLKPPYDWSCNCATNSLRPAINGWTNIQVSGSFLQTNTDQLDGYGGVPIFTTAPTTYTEPGNLPILQTHTFVGSNRDHFAGSAWGDDYVWATELLPILRPFNTPQIIPSLRGQSYAGHSGLMATGTSELVKDRDLHHGIPGTLLSTDPNSSTLDPVAIGPGRHKITKTWTLDSGPNGFPGEVQPNAKLIAVLEFNVEIGDPGGQGEGGPPPPQPINCVVGSWSALSSTTTDTPAVTNGNVQNRTETTTTQQQRPILTQPANGGTGCPVN